MAGAIIWLSRVKVTELDWQSDRLMMHVSEGQLRLPLFCLEAWKPELPPLTP
jgi:hypothetical protein